MNRALTLATYGLTTMVGLMAFLYPFWMPVVIAGNDQQAHAGDSALVLTLLVGICLAVLLLEVQSQGISTKAIALLGVLIAINATFRFAEVAVPGPGGFSLIFPLIILTGYVYGGRFGFLVGALTLLVSGIITGAVGPWLPYQMFTAGWVGLTAPLCRFLVRDHTGTRYELWVLALFAGIWGLLFGLIMNLWFWPYAVGASQMYWTPGISVWDTMSRYLVFYAVTSLVWDIARAVGNVLLILFIGAPVLRVLRRFQRRFAFQYSPARWTNPHVAG